MELSFLQHYWWFIISLLGALLVFLLLVQGGQSMLGCTRGTEARQLMVNSLGRKWEITFTTLVVFGGAFFASFPLFYSTSFGGAYWLWMLILLSFILQAVSYEFRRRRGNLYGTATYDAFLMFNGLVGCVLLGVAVASMFFGGDFTVAKQSILDGASPVISRWGSARGLDLIIDWRCFLLGFAVFFLARTQAALYFTNSIAGAASLGIATGRRVLINGAIAAGLIVFFLIVLFLSPGVVTAADGTMAWEPYAYWRSLVAHWWWMIVMGLGVVGVLYAIGRTFLQPGWRMGIWYSGVGTVLVVCVLLWLAGYGGMAYLPSTAQVSSSLTIANSSSSQFTLSVMTAVSLLVPLVVWYIAWVWRKMDSKPLTSQELEAEHHTY